MTMFAYYQTEAYRPVVLEIYHEFFKEWSIDEIKQACSRHMASEKWFPKCCELTKLKPGPNVPLIEDTATVQAHHVLEIVRTRGGYFTDVRWVDQITEKLMHSRWNYYTLCEIKEDKTTWFIKEFVTAYLSLSRVAHNDANLQVNAPEKLKQLAAGLFKGVDDDR